MSFSQLVSELGPPPEKVKSKKKKKKKKKAFRLWAPPPANSWTRACNNNTYIYLVHYTVHQSLVCQTWHWWELCFFKVWFSFTWGQRLMRFSCAEFAISKLLSPRKSEIIGIIWCEWEHLCGRYSAMLYANLGCKIPLW